MRILVVDDEELARGRLVRMLAAIPDMKVVGEAGDGVSALAQIEALRPDLVLLDVEMPGLDGLAVAERPDMPPIVFTTAHSRFAVDAFEADAYDFLLKPVSRDRLLRAIEKVRARRLAAVGPRGSSRSTTARRPGSSMPAASRASMPSTSTSLPASTARSSSCARLWTSSARSSRHLASCASTAESSFASLRSAPSS